MIQSLSVIIPTYQRSFCIDRLLQHLDKQEYPSDLWDIFIVNDGSNDPEYDRVLSQPFHVRIESLHQNHQGAAAARNLGACRSQADILLFLDDDIIVEPHFIRAIIDEHNHYERAIIMGFFQPFLSGQDPPFRIANSLFTRLRTGSELVFQVPYTDCTSHNLSIKRRHFLELNMFQDPTNGCGWPNWDDIDLAYRAHQEGFLFIRTTKAVGSHIDYACEDFNTFCQRNYRAGKSAVYLFEKYPDLEQQLPMFHDKTTSKIFQDPFFLYLRKVFRRVTARKPVIAVMEKAISLLEKKSPNSVVLHQLYRWTNSSYIYNGYRQGLKEKSLGI